jgi:hypothetical protein
MTQSLPSPQEMFDLAYARLVQQYRSETDKDASYLARNWDTMSPDAILNQLGLPPTRKRMIIPQHPKSAQSSGQSSGQFSGQSDVGYRKPPLHTRFKPGQSGNPRGRPPKADRDIGATLSDIQRRVFQTPLNLSQSGVVSQVPPLEALYRNRNKLSFSGSVLSTENAIRDIVAQMKEDQKVLNDAKQSIRDWISAYPAKLIAIHEGRLDVRFCIPHPDYYTFHADGRVTVKGPRMPDQLFTYETIKLLACYATARSAYDAIVHRNLLWLGKHDHTYFAIHAHVQQLKTLLPMHLIKTVRSWEFYVQKHWHDADYLEMLYSKAAEQTGFPFQPAVPMSAPDTKLTQHIARKFGTTG